jgi:hypothetical protein
MRLAGTIKANGYFFETGAGPVEHDPVRWVLEVADDAQEATWETIGASFMMWNQSAVQVLHCIFHMMHCTMHANSFLALARSLDGNL